ncbi:uncharacterized protein K460DRAFT_393036 [Cucurbitaria berberidis CBS 394.84]|uniref:Uncharacterized protein n=1 Tax=Cucurbitaria berberidis CBS 394.84 TaxID=1168544 RepID=A0A9P4LAW3_9PLEO|nr:uncharacterized protein K460DRAFT_393036 [Cucurbitaria berberidis CBS 394.84]KAF1847777.1 hypothetical protein K460DRAFT_393036 [Cucurbitaria berberidis CBS 394.84]
MNRACCSTSLGAHGRQSQSSRDQGGARQGAGQLVVAHLDGLGLGGRGRGHGPSKPHAALLVAGCWLLLLLGGHDTTRQADSRRCKRPKQVSVFSYQPVPVPGMSHHHHQVKSRLSIKTMERWMNAWSEQAAGRGVLLRSCSVLSGRPSANHKDGLGTRPLCAFFAASAPPESCSIRRPRPTGGSDGVKHQIMPAKRQAENGSAGGGSGGGGGPRPIPAPSYMVGLLACPPS